jgi:hypothetical protein
VRPEYAAFELQAVVGFARHAAQAASPAQAEASPQQVLLMHDAQSGRESVTPPQAGPPGFGIVGMVGMVGMVGIVGVVVPPPTATQVGFDAQMVLHALPHWHFSMSL